MSNEDNKLIVKKAQEILEQFGHKVKISHVYETLSQLAGFKDWNTASAKGVKFKELLPKLQVPKKLEELDLPKGYLKLIAEGKTRDFFFLGKIIESGKEMLKDFTREPNALFVGSMGSGKSVSACFTALTWLLSNSDRTQMFIIDPNKGAADYRALFNCPQVIPVLNDQEKSFRVIDLMYEEAMARRDAFNEHKAASIAEYEERSGKTLTRLVVLMEEFHAYGAVFTSESIRKPGTSAHKIHQILRIGRSLGIWVIASTQRATKSDIPPEMVPNFTQKQVFRVSRTESSYLLATDEAGNLSSADKGKCVTEYGKVQFDWISPSDQEALVKMLTSPLKSQSLSFDSESLNKFINQMTAEEVYERKNSQELLENIASYDAPKVLKVIFERLGYKVTPLVNNSFDAHLVMETQGKKHVIMIRSDKDQKVMPKHLMRLSKAKEALETEGAILFVGEKDMDVEVYKYATDLGVELADLEDLINLVKRG